MNRKIISALSLARRGGKLEIGFLATKTAVEKNRARVVAVTSDISEGTLKKIKRVCVERNVDIAYLPITRGDLEKQGMRSIVLCAICDDNFKNLLDKAMREAGIC
ncbi:MAG: hypothetical protein GX222_01160 [Ruminococcaceae bacterium]|nr:hypothetical protein [Oscillospiraceae bacterium]